MSALLPSRDQTTKRGGGSFAAQLQQAREALDDFANPQHWAVDRTFEPPRAVWIGTYTKSPVDHARAALAAAAPATPEAKT